MRCLFIGGCIDGQWRELPDGERYYRAIPSVPHTFPEGPVSPEPVRDEMYRYAYVHLEPSCAAMTSATVFVPMDADPQTTLMKLLVRYKGRKA